MNLSLGISGDQLTADENFVYKICQTDQVRFLKNIEKQKAFHNPYIQAVPILEQGQKDDKFFIKMPRLKCTSSLQWIAKANLDQINKFLEIILKYFIFSINQSEVKKFDHIIWSNKLIELENKIIDNHLLQTIQDLKSITFNNKFYYGNCHGDFTLSNMFIFSKDDVSIDAIDFLSSFIESPLLDIVKLRQDTKHLWTLNLDSNINNNYNNIIISLNYIDKVFEKFIQGNEILSEYYLPFQILNLMRIIPYTKDNSIFNYLKDEILELSQWLPH